MKKMLVLVISMMLIACGSNQTKAFTSAQNKEIFFTPYVAKVLQGQKDNILYPRDVDNIPNKEIPVGSSYSFYTNETITLDKIVNEKYYFTERRVYEGYPDEIIKSYRENGIDKYFNKVEKKYKENRFETCKFTIGKCIDNEGEIHYVDFIDGLWIYDAPLTLRIRHKFSLIYDKYGYKVYTASHNKKKGGLYDEYSPFYDK